MSGPDGTASQSRHAMDEGMEIGPEVMKNIAYLMGRLDELTDWERNFVDSMTYWLKVRKKAPTETQLLMINMIYSRVKGEHETL